MTNPYELLTILGPTACGKTKLAVAVAERLDGEILSGDSRQVYRGMDLGTGKDLADYTINGHTVPAHLIDICEAGEKYNVYRFQQDFLTAYEGIRHRHKLPILCGGTGLYVESIVGGYRLSPVPQNPELRARLEGHTLAELTEMLATYKTLHNHTDVDTAQRAIRAIEIEEHYRQHPIDPRPFPKLHSLIIGVHIDRNLRREKITTRLRQRLNEGMVEEVQALLASGISADDLIYYGLEYKFVTLYAIGQLSFEEMFQQLEIAIHQFAKRQMTWFRGMERRGHHIHWLDAENGISNNAEAIRLLWQKGE